MIRSEKWVIRVIIRSEKWVIFDFFVQKNGKKLHFSFEVKAKTTKAKSLSTALKHPDKYHVYHAIKFGDFNIGREGPLLTLPNYIQFLLDLKSEEIVLEPLDVDAVNAMAREMLNKSEPAVCEEGKQEL